MKKKITVDETAKLLRSLHDGAESLPIERKPRELPHDYFIRVVMEHTIWSEKERSQYETSNSNLRKSQRSWPGSPFFCGECGDLKVATLSGICCPNGHGRVLMGHSAGEIEQIRRKAIRERLKSLLLAVAVEVSGAVLKGDPRRGLAKVVGEGKAAPLLEPWKNKELRESYEKAPLHVAQLRAYLEGSVIGRRKNSQRLKCYVGAKSQVAKLVATAT